MIKNYKYTTYFIFYFKEIKIIYYYLCIQNINIIIIYYDILKHL